MDLKVNDKVELKKTHPCGSKEWLVLRIGMDIKLRRKVEKSIRRIITEEENA